MSSLVILPPQPPLAIGGNNGGSTVQNLLTADPREVWLATLGTSYFDVDLGPSEFGPSVPRLADAGGAAIINGISFRKVAATDGWTGRVQSTVGYDAGAQVSFTAPAATKDAVVGLTRASTRDRPTGFASPVFGWIISNGNTVVTLESSVTAQSFAYTPGDKLTVSVADGQVRYFKNDVLMRSIGLSDPVGPWYFDASIYTASGVIQNALFRPNLREGVDSIFVGYTNAAGDTDMYVQPTEGGNGVSGGLSSFVYPTSGSGQDKHFFNTFPINYTRYFRIVFRLGLDQGTLRVGCFALGRKFQPAYGHEYGSGRAPIDTGSRERLKAGGFGVSPGIVKGSWNWTMGDLSGAEVDRLYEIARGLGETRPVVVVEDPDNTAGLSRRIHWGMFEKLQAYERLDPQNTRWSFNIEDWL